MAYGVQQQKSEEIHANLGKLIDCVCNGGAIRPGNGLGRGTINGLTQGAQKTSGSGASCWGSPTLGATSGVLCTDQKGGSIWRWNSLVYPSDSILRAGNSKKHSPTAYVIAMLQHTLVLYM